MGASVSGLAGDGKCPTGGVASGQRTVTVRAEARAASHADQLVGGSAREKKKKMTGFATLRRKLIRRRRISKSFDHGKVMREFVADWSPLELNTLVEEYEATAALKDLSVQADLARPPASTFKQDLSDLFDYKYASDVTLVFQGACFPAHRAILSARCAYFRELLNHPSARPQLGAGGGVAQQVTVPQVHVDSLLQSRGIDVSTFAALLRYLYTGDFNLDGESSTGSSCGTDMPSDNLEVLIRLGQEFGTPNALELDLRFLMETGDLADAVLVFASGQDFPALTAVSGANGITNSNTRLSLSGSGQGGINCGPASDYGFFPWLEIPCHRAVLSARSPFFRSLIQRRTRSEAVSVTPIRIVLDESVIPRRYARVLMQALYLDTIDMNCIVRSGYAQQQQQPQPQQPQHQLQQQQQANDEVVASCTNTSAIMPSSLVGSTSTTSTVGPINNAGRLSPPTLFEEATELYQIGRFLDLDILSQGCEDVIVDNLCLDNLPQVLRWSELPHGSSWVRRQAIHLLREEFSAIAQAPVLLELDKAHLVEALQSDFLQASELEVLQAVLRWGEHQLVRRMEDREPNVISQTAHSVARKGIRRRDLNDVELRDILSELLPHVRVDHILPPNHECLAQAIRRGLVSTPPSHMIGGDKMMGAERGELLRLHAWIRGKNHGLYVKPRLFMPYFEEAKSLLADQLVHEMELVRLRMVRMSSHNIPDTLYMIDDAPMAMSGMDTSGELHGHVPASYQAGEAGQNVHQANGSHSNHTSDLDIITGAVPVPDSETLQSMIRRERELRSSPLCLRAYSLPLASRRGINRQIRLRVVREFNLPDSIAEELELAAYQFAEEAEECHQQQLQQQQQSQQQVSNLVWEPRKPGHSAGIRVPIPPKRAASSRPRQLHHNHEMHKAELRAASQQLAALDLPVDDPIFRDEENGNSGDDNEDGVRLHHSQLSEFIPDIAALSIINNPHGAHSQMNMPHFVAPLQPPEAYRELQLDLGDGAGSSVVRLNGAVEWSIVRPSQHASASASALPSSHPVRMSTFRSEDDPWAAEQQQQHPPQQQPQQQAQHPIHQQFQERFIPSNISPRSQRRSRSSRAADVRVFI